MRVDKLTIGRIFDPTERLEAPLFQRPYVWDEERNWIPMWDSIQGVADGVLAVQQARPHFLGAIVLDQLVVCVRQMADYDVRDGPA